MTKIKSIKAVYIVIVMFVCLLGIFACASVAVKNCEKVSQKYASQETGTVEGCKKVVQDMVYRDALKKDPTLREDWMYPDITIGKNGKLYTAVLTYQRPKDKVILVIDLGYKNGTYYVIKINPATLVLNLKKINEKTHEVNKAHDKKS